MSHHTRMSPPKRKNSFSSPTPPKHAKDLIGPSPSKRTKKLHERVDIIEIYDINVVNFPSDINDPLILEELACSVCFDISPEPQMFPCQHSCCKTCVSKLIKTNNEGTCPSCRKNFHEKEVRKNLLQTRMIEHLKIRCLHPECEWTGPKSSLGHHLQSCEFLYKCPCGDIFEINNKDIHEKVCPLAEIKCVCGETIKIKNIEEHNSQSCPDVEVVCHFAEHGCSWTGKRGDLLTFHLCKCPVGMLVDENKELKKQTTEKPSELMVRYSKSDCFSITGISRTQNERKKIVEKFAFSFLKLSFPVSIGSFESDLVVLNTVTNDSNFVYRTNSENGGKKACQIEIDPDQGVMSITMSDKMDRFFIIPTPGQVFKITKGKSNTVSIGIPAPPKRFIRPSTVLYATRRWLLYSDNEEHPFVMEPSTRHYTLISFKYKPEIEDTLLRALNTFFKTTDS